MHTPSDDNVPLATGTARIRAAAEILLAGQSAEQVSETLNISLRTVKAYGSTVASTGLEALDQLTTCGHRSTLDAKALRGLKAALEKGPRAHGFESELWRNRDVQALVKRRFDIDHSNGYVRQLLRAWASSIGCIRRSGAPKPVSTSRMRYWRG